MTVEKGFNSATDADIGVRKSAGNSYTNTWRRAMDDETFIATLRGACSEAITEYRAQFPDGIPLTEFEDRDVGPFASAGDVDARFTDFTEFYDGLFDVDSTPYRDEWREKLVYDCTRRERLEQLTNDLPRSLTFLLIEGRYVRSTGHIGVSHGRLPPATAYSFLASELCHAYQDRFDTPTWTHPYAMEGFEQAASHRALEHLASTLDDDSIAQAAAKDRARILLQGVMAHETRRGGITPATIRELGVTDEELASLRSHLLWRPVGYLRPRHRWDTMAFDPTYDLLGSLLLVSEREGVADVYARAFRGEHPWEALVADIRSEPLPWVWRLGIVDPSGD